MNIKALLTAYFQIANQEKKQKEFDKLQTLPLNYGILKDLINSAAYGIDIEIKFTDGNTVHIRRDEKKQTIVDTGAF